MSIPLTINSVTFQFPQVFDKNWGATVTNWATAVTNALKPLAGGFLTLSPYPSTGINFANATNTGFIALTINSSNQLTFNGVPIGATTSLTNGHIYVGNVTNNPADVAMSGDITISNTGVTTLGALKVSDSQISATAAISLSKLASTSPYYWYAADSMGVLAPLGVTASKVVITDANGLPSASSVTPTELSYLSGVTSPIQTQLGTYLPLSGGTMSGAINMASNKIQSLASGTTGGDAASYGQIIYLTAPSKTIVTGDTTTASLTYVSTALTATITPSSISSRVKITITTGYDIGGSSPQTIMYVTIFRDSTNIAIGSSASFAAVRNNLSQTMTGPIAITTIDSPATTSATAYTVKIRSTGSTVSLGGANTDQVMILEEIR